VGGLKVPAPIQQSVQPGHAHVVHRRHSLPENLRRRSRLFGDRHVGRPCRDNQHLARLWASTSCPLYLWRIQDHGPPYGIMLSVTIKPQQGPSYKGIHPGGQDRMPMPLQPPRNP
jgi:hypothetical protein